MRRIIVLGSLAVAALASVVLLGVVPNLQTVRSAGCSNSTLQGAYAWMGNGVLGEKTWTGIGIETFDGAGNSSSQGTRSLNGQIAPHKFTGAYTVNANCTGSIKQTYPDGYVGHLDIIVTDGGHEVYWIVTDSGVTISGIKKKI
jgi:hypothetical protein